jgi:L-2,4-diaminobutyrate decarboxylase
MATSFVANARIVVESLADYYRDSISRRRPVISQRPLGQLIEELELEQLAVEGGLDGERRQRFLRRYLDATTRLHHPAYLAHQVAVPHPNVALAAFVDGFTNNAMAIYEMGPPVAAIEYFIIHWLLQKIGWHSPPEKPSNASGPGGVLTHGRSLANLTALLAARARAAPEAWKDGSPGDLAFLVPAAAHYSIARAAGILGIGVNHLYLLETDSR